MKPLLVVDGYNVIGAWELAAKKGWSFEECREQLTVRLEEYAAFHGCEVILVFDGTRSERLLRSHDTRGAVEVVFTRHGEIADQYIERLCGQQPRWREVRVATSDNVEQTVILGRGATRLPSRELLRDDYYKEVQGEVYQGVTPREGTGNIPEEGSGGNTEGA